MAKTTPKEREEREFDNQYRRIKDNHVDRGGLGCGICILMTDTLKFISPIQGDMRIEVQTGIRISVAHADFLLSRVFLIPIPFIEEIFIRPNPAEPATEEEAIQFVVIPVAMIGASALLRDLPLPIIFIVADTEPTGSILEYRKEGEDSHASIIERVFNSELTRVNNVARVQDLPPLTIKNEVTNGFEASWQESSQLNEDADTRKQHIKGLLYLTRAGILFLAQEASKTIYLPFRSIGNLLVIVIKDLASGKRPNSNSKSKSKSKTTAQSTKPVALEINFMIQATEPWYDGEPKDPTNTNDGIEKKKSGHREKKSHTIMFTQIPMRMLDTIKVYMEAHEELEKLSHQLCEMKYLDHAAGTLLSGLEPYNKD